MPEKPTYEELEQRVLELEKADSKQKRTEDALREKVAFLSKLIDLTPIPVFYKDRDGQYHGFNKAFETFFGENKDLLIGKTLFDINPPELATIYQAMDNELFEDKGIQHYEAQVKNVHGALRDVIFNKSVLTDNQGVASGIIGSITDITERKQAEEAILDSEKRFRAAFMSSPVAICISRLEDGVWIDINQAEQNLYGYAREEMIGKSAIAANVWVDLDDRKRLVDAISRNKVVREQQMQQRRKDGSLFLASVSARLLILKGVKHILFATEDITDRKRAEDQIKQNLLEKEILLREIHHRVKNNLAVISSLLGLQANRIKESAVKEMMDACQQRIKSMALVHEKMYNTDNLSCVDFKDYISSIVQDLASAYQKDNIVTRISARNIQLDIGIATPCGLIINELVTNAMKHAFADTINPELNIDFEKADNTYTLKVQDNGIGLPEDIDTCSTSTLGLMLVRALTRQLRGSLHFDSDATVRQGTSVIFRFEEKGRKSIGAT